MTGPWVAGVDSLVRDIPAGARIGVSGFHFTRAPMAQLLALAETRVGDLWYVSWGGGLPLELLLDRKLVSRATLCFSSLDVLGPAPRFRRAVDTGSLRLEEWTALGMINAFRAAGENLPFAILQEPAGSSLTSGFSRPVEDPYAQEGPPMAAVRALPLDVLLLHAQRADEDGNVEIAGARGLDLSALFAARQVLVTVEERVPRGRLGAPRSFIVPRTFVAGLAPAPGGAYPTSCLPYYPADFRALRALTEHGREDSLPERLLRPPPGRLAVLSRRAAAPAYRICAEVREEAATKGAWDTGVVGGRNSGDSRDGEQDWSIDELMVCVLARTIDGAGVCSVGSASPLPTAAYMLAKHLWAPGLLVMSHNGGLVDLPVRPLTVSAAEQVDVELAAAHAGGDETYHWYYQRGLVTHEAVGSAQVDGRGATNNLRVSARDGRVVRLPGQGGMADVANLHANFVVYLPRHATRNTPGQVEVVSARRMWHDADERRRYGLRPGRTLVLTDLGLFEYDTSAGGLVLRSVHPGVTGDDVGARTGFAVTVAGEVAVTEPPTPEELVALRTVVDPLGVRRLDLVGSADRRALVDAILDTEERILDSLAHDETG